MLAAMNDWNSLSLAVVIALFLLWKLELVATLLNLKSYPEKVPDELEDVMNASKLDEGRSYQRVNATFDIIRSTSSLTVLLVFWFCGGFGWLDALARELAPMNVPAGLVFLAALFLGQSLLSLPFDVYDTFVIEARFGFNRSTPATFVMDRLKGLLLAAVIGLPLAAAVLWIFHEIDHAWLWAWLVLTAVQLLLAWVAPTWIMPLFNKFTPMPDGPLKDEIDALGMRCGFPLSGVFVMDGSKRSTKANAFFTGFGKNRKIALFDTLIEKNSIPELIGVLAHEIGHFRRSHIKQRLAAGIFQTGAIFWLLGLATDPDGRFARLLFDGFGVRDISPHVGLVLFSILLEPFNKALGVVMN